MQKKIYTTLFLLFFAIVGVIFYPSKIETIIIPTDYKEWNKNLDKVIYSLNENDRRLLKGYLDRHNPELNDVSEAIPIHLSIEQAIKLQKIYLDSPEAKTALEKKNKEEKYTQLKLKIIDTLFIAYISKVNDNNNIVITYAYKNKSEKDITSFKARIVYVDKKGTTIESKNIEHKYLIPANSTITYNEKYNKENFSNFDIIKELDTHDLDCNISINSITFSDGTSIQLSNE